MESWRKELYSSELYHHGILGQKWGVRRYQNYDGTRTSAGKRRASDSQKRGLSDKQKKVLKIAGGAVLAAAAAYGAYKLNDAVKIKNRKVVDAFIDRTVSTIDHDFAFKHPDKFLKEGVFPTIEKFTGEMTGRINKRYGKRGISAVFDKDFRKVSKVVKNDNILETSKLSKQFIARELTNSIPAKSIKDVNLNVISEKLSNLVPGWEKMFFDSLS